MVTEITLFQNLAFRLTHKLISHPLFNQYFNSLDDLKELTGFEKHELEDIFTQGEDELATHFENIGKKLFLEFHPPFIDITQFLEFAANELSTLILKHDMNYPAERVLTLYQLIRNSIAKSYFYLTLNDIALMASQAHEEEYSPLSIHFLWLENTTKYLSGLIDTPPEKDHLSCDFSHWLNSLECELLLSCTGEDRTEHQAKIFLSHRMIHQQLIYVISFVKEKDFAQAFSHLQILYQSVLEMDQQIRSLQLYYIKNEEYHFFNFIDQKASEVNGLYYFVSIRIQQTQTVNFRKQVFHKLQSVKNDLQRLLKIIGIDGITLLYDNQMTIFFQIKSPMSELKVQNFMQNELHPFIKNITAKDGYSSHSIGIKMDTINSYREHRIAILKELEHYQVSQDFTYFSKTDAEQLYLETIKSQRISQLTQKALEEDQLEVFYQPIVQSKESPLQYVEALVRAPSEEGYIDAEQFIHFLESKNKMKDLDLLVMRHIKQTIPRLSKLVNKISVNIYPNSFKEPEIIASIIDLNETLQSSGINLVLEITEYVFIQDMEVIETLATENGITLAMDDFGSGYSNLLQLIEYSERGILEILKVDGSIVKKIDTNETVFMVLQSIIKIAKILNMTPIVMEYVYNEEIHHKLESLGIPLNYQGYFFAEPLSLDDLETRYS